jgi:hypothetical protein
VDARASFAAWIEALNHPRDRARLLTAVTRDVRVERHDALAPGAEPGPPAEVFEGALAVGGWLARMRKPVTFSLAGEPAPVDGGWQVEYALVMDDFENGGVWLARLADDGKVAWLSHRPFPVPERYERVEP